jgi:hypothetical protein
LTSTTDKWGDVWVWRDEYLLALHAHRVCRDIIARRSTQYAPIADIELRQVDWTGKCAAGQLTIAKCAADVRAVVADGVDAPVDVGETHERCPNLDTQCLAGRDFVEPRHWNKRLLAVQ